MTAENHDISVRQRARADRGGKNAATAMYGSASAEPFQEPIKAVVKNPVKDNYRNASEFYAGPSKPGKLRANRNEAANADSVAYLLTDEGLMDGRNAPPPHHNRTAALAAAAGGRGLPRGAAGGRNNGPATVTKKPKVPEAERDHVDHVCAPTNPEPKWRSGVRVTHQSGGMDAPYFEDLDPRPARDQPPVAGKRHVRPTQLPAKTIFLDPTRRLTEEEAEAARQSTNGRTNKSNLSVNVLCLNHYSPQQLNEPREVNRPQGPRRWAAPDMPPARHPVIAPIKTHAKDEHDVLGTGRWGHAEEPRPRGLAKGACRPTKDSANIFAGDSHQSKRRNWVPANEARRQTAQQRKHAGQPQLLKYYDPTVDGTIEAKPIPPHGNRTNEESKNEKLGPYRPSRGAGTYAKNALTTNKSLW